MTHDPDESLLLPATPKAWFLRWFEKYSRKKLRKSFFAVRGTPGLAQALRDFGAHAGPVLVVATHSSWWDPIVGLALLGMYMPERTVRAPMDIDQLRRFGFFRGVGIFGVDPDNPNSLAAMSDYALEYFRTDPRPTLWVTPQGRFADPRTTVRVRPGAAALAARAGDGLRVLAIAMEYAFWADQKPELFLNAAPVEPDRASTTGWQRAIVSTMQLCSDELAARVIARDPTGFVNLLGGEDAKTNPMWDLLLRVRGQTGGIDPTRRKDGDLA